MSDAPPDPLFTRVTAMVTEFIDWIGGRTILTMPRYFYRKANRHLRLIEDMVRGALYILSLDLMIEPQAPKPVAPKPSCAASHGSWPPSPNRSPTHGAWRSSWRNPKPRRNHHHAQRANYARHRFALPWPRAASCRYSRAGRPARRI